MSEPMRVQVSEPGLPAIKFYIAAPLEADCLIRIAANGVAMLSSMVITRVRITHPSGRETEPAIRHRYTREEMELDWNWYIRTLSMAVLELPAALEPGTMLAVETQYRETSQAGSCIDQPSRYAGLCWTMALRRIADLRAEAGEPVGEDAALLLVPGPAKRIEAYLKPDGRVLTTAFDAFGNPVAAGALSDAKDAAGASGGRQRVSGHGFETVTNARPVTIGNLPVWFGEFHWHTDFSGDGQRPLAEALASARDELGLDFAGPTDHMGANGRYSRVGPQEQAAICVQFDNPGTFCTLPGAELSRRYGHTNIYTDSFETLIEITSRFARELAPAWCKEPDRYMLAALLRLCIPGKSIVVPHHANMDSFLQEHVLHPDGRPYWCAMHFPIPADRAIVRLYEMVQSRGAFESEIADETWRIHDGGFGGSVHTALMRGYRFGFVAGTDNHCGWPTRCGSGYSGVTAVAAARLDTASIFDALYRRRCYATSGARIVADATLNGFPAGSELVQEPGAKRLFKIKVRGTQPLTHVQIIHLGCILADLPIEADSPDCDVEWADERPGRPLEDAWYYVRIRQADGHCAWLSPFWVDLP